MKFLPFLHQPYPFYYRGCSLSLISALAFLFAFCFYLLFQPFEINRAEHRFPFFAIALVHALIPGLLLPLLGLVFHARPKLEDRWTLRAEFLFFGIFLLLVGVGQFLIRDLIYDIPDNWSPAYLWEEVRNTFSIGLLFVALCVPINYNYLNRQHVHKATTISDRLVKDQAQGRPSEELLIVTQVQQEAFCLRVSDLLYARADSNYLELFFQNGQAAPEKIVKRLALKDFMQQVQPYEQILQTHRSFAVNLDFVQQVAGNAQGYRLTLAGTTVTIPVSRNRLADFEARFQKFQSIPS
ncbi:MAG: LytTR family transcriptional regulator [Phaeodactylibacter sp.]|nr:LytTR family transcriptional regulator [Phaeodactylibacter sp.]